MYNKPFKTYKEQIEILESRNLKFSDSSNAEYIIMNSSYYGLINGYKDLFILPKKNNKDEDDYNGNNFDDIRRLYDFDKELSGVLYKYLLKIETTFKTSLTYHISENIGYLQQEYLSPNNYKPGREVDYDKSIGETVYSRERTLSIIEEKIKNPASKPIEFYDREYNNVPPWIVSDALTLGNLVNWYAILDPVLKEKIAQVFIAESNGLNSEDMKNLFLTSIKNTLYFRNIIAHGSRVYCSNSFHAIENHSLNKFNPNIRGFNYNYHVKQEKRAGLFNLLIEICILFSKRNTVRNKFINEIETVFADYKEKDVFFYNKMMKQIQMPFSFIEILRELTNNRESSASETKDKVSAKGDV